MAPHFSVGVLQTERGHQHADREAQFHHINAQAKAHLAAGQPAVSVDRKWKVLMGDYDNGIDDFGRSSVTV